MTEATRTKRTLSGFVVTSLAIAGLTTLSGATSQAEPLKEPQPYQLTPEVQQAYEKLNQDASVQQGLAFMKADHQQTIQDQIAVTEIPAPPFKENERAQYYKGRLEALGLEGVQQDEEGNVYGMLKGSGNGPTLFVSAHLDTVFPEGTDTTVRERDGKLCAPGIGDDGRGLASVLSIVRAFKESGVRPEGDIIFGGTVGEEGLGDLRGVKHFFAEHAEVDGFISIESGSPAGITYKATGSHRYVITYKGPGGHSFGAFGTPNAIHAMGRAIAGIADVKVPAEPKTTFNVGVVEGGTSINSIPADAKMQLDMRSNDEEELLKLEQKVMKIVDQASEDENKRWRSDQMTVQKELVGDRPAATQPDDALIVQTGWAGAQSAGLNPSLGEPSSTDSNYPMSLGIPSLTLRGGGVSTGTHSPEECFDPTDAYLGPQRSYMTILGLVGVRDVSQPLLPQRN
ncbi:M20/M25/M40 family metallo-hydrolase [Micromonospora sp. CB01531]|uniref:M20/M25/M40 family metallo-hydrolase n=1 Tax=Micromonospora sp. CB01531 TaxID=1718947 RepID=UPI0018E9A991|nr:M20/M25/M40 family metallo-hydrolase [Micromonospora sp. CB01531]